MRITQIEVENSKGDRFAKISRQRFSSHIDVEILTADSHRKHEVLADDRDDQWSMAECLQETLDGVRGTGGDIREYLRIIEHFAD